jgi:hypothetical protein
MIYMMDVDPPTSYAGQCHGGPMDGQWLQHSAAYYRIGVFPPFKTIRAMTAIAKTEVIGVVKTGEYRWHKDEQAWVWVG